MSSFILDILIAAGLATGIARGWKTGATRQIAGLAGTVISIVLALQLMGPAGRVVAALLGVGEIIAPIIGFVIMFVVAQLALRALTRAIESSLKALRLGMLNRAGGAAFGACTAALLISVLFLLLNFFQAPDPPSRANSLLYNPVAAVFPASWDFVAQRFSAVMELSDRFGGQAGGTEEEGLPGDPSTEADSLASDPLAEPMDAAAGDQPAGGDAAAEESSGGESGEN